MTKAMRTDESLLGEISRRNWYIWGALVLLSLLWRSPNVTLGVAGGGLVTIAGFYWLHRSLGGIFCEAEGKSHRGYLFSSLIRLLVLVGALFLLLVPGRAQPLALGCGVSVVVLNLMWTSLTRIFPREL